jgi:hypothetical protein
MKKIIISDLVFRFPALIIIFLLLNACDPSNNFQGHNFDTSEVTVFGISSKQIIYFSKNNNQVTAFNTNDSEETKGTWEFSDDDKQNIKMTFESGKYDWQSGNWRFNDNYTVLTNIDRNEIYFKRK